MPSELVAFKLKALAATPGKSKNNVFYSKQVLTDAAPKYPGKPFILDHDIYSAEKVYGIIKQGTYGFDRVHSGQQKEGLWLTGVGKMPKSLFERVKGSKSIPSLIKHVSIGGEGEGIFEPDQITLTSFEPQELSLTAFPGIPDAEIVQIDAIQEHYSRPQKVTWKMPDKVVEVSLDEAQRQANNPVSNINNSTTTVSATAPGTLTIPVAANATSTIPVTSSFTIQEGPAPIKEQEDDNGADDVGGGLCPKCGSAMNADGECSNCGYKMNAEDEAETKKAKPTAAKEQDEDEEEDEAEEDGEEEEDEEESEELHSGNKVPSTGYPPSVPSGSVKGKSEAETSQKVKLAPPAEVPLKTTTTANVSPAPFDLTTRNLNVPDRMRELYVKLLAETNDPREATRRAWILAQKEILEPSTA